MKPEDFPATDASPDSVAPSELKFRIDADEDVFVLDVRAASNYEEWHIDSGVESLNVPYFEFLDGLPEDSLAALPDDRTVTVVCAKGTSSEFVAGRLLDAGYDAEQLADGMRGWARVYESREVETGGDATVVQYRRPSSGCLAYLVASNGEGAVVDPLRAFTDAYVEDARERGVSIEYAVDTHVHADHVSGVRELAAATGATVVLPEAAVARGVDYEAPFETVADGDELTVGDATIEAVHTPGHTTGMTAYRVDDVLFTGDGLFTESVARPDLEDPEAAREAAETLYDTLHERVLAHDDETLVAPAHYGDGAVRREDDTYTARLGEIVDSVDALSLDREAFVEFVTTDMPPRPANHEDIVATNLGERAPSDDEAFTLELGPNNCAASGEAAE
jgi:glyoxylase-like metal-dependent hydrolase (beta-lactamase superfamily II)/rhodanese-related sulfurtransferase